MTPAGPWILRVRVPGPATREPDVAGSYQQAGQAALECLRDAAARTVPELAAALADRLRVATTGQISQQEAIHAARVLAGGAEVLLCLTEDVSAPSEPD
jgi:hypothetical protein